MNTQEERNVLVKYSTQENFCFKCKKELLPEEDVMIFKRDKNKFIHNDCFKELSN